MKGIDVSSYQGKIDWKSVKNSGVEFAILKVIRKDLSPDKQFFNNLNRCQEVGMPIQGVYNYTYATTIAKAKEAAEAVIKTLGSCKTFVWLDVEDACMKGLGSYLADIVNAYKDIIVRNGHSFGVYTGAYFYKTYFKPYASRFNCPFWVARYPSSLAKTIDDIPNSKSCPVINHVLYGWQWSSKGQIPGISGNVDLNIWYEDAEGGLNPYVEPTRTIKKTVPTMKGEDVKWVQWELSESGYLDFNDIDGSCGKKTDTAIRAFQTANNLICDGKVGPATRKAMKELR